MSTLASLRLAFFKFAFYLFNSAVLEVAKTLGVNFSELLIKRLLVSPCLTRHCMFVFSFEKRKLLFKMFNSAL